MVLVSPTRATHFFQSRLRAPDKSKQKRLPRSSGPARSAESTHPSAVPGSAYTGRPWPVRPLAASMRLDPLHDTGVRPPERGDFASLKVLVEKPEPTSSVDNSQVLSTDDVGIHLWKTLRGFHATNPL
ncbi:MAG TPA: hypothetical protein DGS68_08195 [Pseudomonas sp.]|nr:hypothetical protein [Pseudomonas sp.]